MKPNFVRFIMEFHERFNFSTIFKIFLSTFFSQRFGITTTKQKNPTKVTLVIKKMVLNFSIVLRASTMKIDE